MRQGLGACAARAFVGAALVAVLFAIVGAVFIVVRDHGDDLLLAEAFFFLGGAACFSILFPFAVVEEKVRPFPGVIAGTYGSALLGTCLALLEVVYALDLTRWSVAKATERIGEACGKLVEGPILRVAGLVALPFVIAALARRRKWALLVGTFASTLAGLAAAAVSWVELLPRVSGKEAQGLAALLLGIGIALPGLLRLADHLGERLLDRVLGEEAA